MTRNVSSILLSKEETLSRLKTDLTRQMNLTSTVQQSLNENTTPAEAINHMMDSARRHHNDKIDELESRINAQLSQLESKIEEFQSTRDESSKKADEIIVDTIETSIESLRHKLNIISADKTGMADFALESAGAEIVSG